MSKLRSNGNQKRLSCLMSDLRRPPPIDPEGLTETADDWSDDEPLLTTLREDHDRDWDRDSPTTRQVVNAGGPAGWEDYEPPA